MNFNITRAAHAEIRVTDLNRARIFYVDALGMSETARKNDRLYLGGYDERNLYSLVLRESESPGLGHIAFRVAQAGDLFEIRDICESYNLPTKWTEAYAEEVGQGMALRIQDPSGLPVEFYHEMDKRESMMRKYHLHRGANIMRIDHFNVQVPNVHKAYEWWTKLLGFRCSEFMYKKDDMGKIKLWGPWLHRKQNVHDIALMNGVGPRLHHVAMWVRDENHITNACKILASMGMQKYRERGPDIHGLSNANFVYLRDPDGNRIELYTGDYMITDLDNEPLAWDRNDPQAGSFLGIPAPASWYEEASLVENIHTGEFMPISECKLEGQPELPPELKKAYKRSTAKL